VASMCKDVLVDAGLWLVQSAMCSRNPRWAAPSHHRWCCGKHHHLCSMCWWLHRFAPTSGNHRTVLCQFKVSQLQQQLQTHHNV
jgi:hypothetical protein